MIRKQWYVVLESKQVKKDTDWCNPTGRETGFLAGRGWECQLRG